MRRREFLGLLGGAAAWPPAALAQQREPARRIGMLLPATPDDSEYPSLVAAFLAELQLAGYTDGRNIVVETRWAGANPDSIRRHAAELVVLSPDVIMAAGSSTTGPVLLSTRTIPIVFTIVPDPVGAGFVDNLARPGGNATGFTSFEFDISGKWLELLKEIMPGIKRVGVLRDAAITAGIGQWSAIQTAAPRFGMEASPINLRNASDLEASIAAFARVGPGGLIVTSGARPIALRDPIIAQAAKHKLPTVYYSRGFVTAGGLVSYGSDRLDQFRSAAGYVARILKGETPSDLPVQQPTKYQLSLNLKAAKAISLTVPPALLVRADEVIE